MNVASIATGLGIAAGLLAPPTLAQKVPEIGVGETSQVGLPTIAASGDSVYLAWADYRHATGNSVGNDIYFNRSLDGGATWLASDVRANTNPPVTGRTYGIKVAASGETVYVAWLDDRSDLRVRPLSPELDVYFNRSMDGGLTWFASDVRINTGSVGTAYQFDITASGDAVYVAWADQRNDPDPSDIFFNRSLDGGATWLDSDVRVNKGPVGPPALAHSGNAVYVAWVYRGVYLSRSEDSGATWPEPDKRLDTSPADANTLYPPQIETSGDSVYVAWHERRDLQYGVFLNRSLDRGDTWLPSDRQVNADPYVWHATTPQLAVSGSSTYVAWEGWAFPYSNGIYTNRSMDGGVTWLESDRRLDTPRFDTQTLYPRIGATGPSVYVTWQDYVNGSQQSDIYFNRSLDGGATWLASEVQMNAYEGYPTNPEIAVSDDSVYVVWWGFRVGSGSSVDFNIPFGAQPYGAGKAGSGAVAPQLSGTDSLNLGSTYSLTVSDGLGGAPGLFAFGFAGSKTSVPVVGGTLLVNPVAVFPFALGGAQDVPGAGVFVLDIPIPVDVNLLGANLNAQAGILDPGATFGISLSNGVEAWIL